MNRISDFRTWDLGGTPRPPSPFGPWLPDLHLRGPGFFNLDTSLFRDFSISERIKLQIRAEALNATNFTIFNVTVIYGRLIPILRAFWFASHRRTHLGHRKLTRR